MKRIITQTKLGNKTLARVRCGICNSDYFDILPKKEFICDECK